MRHAIIVSGVVQNVVLADPATAAQMATAAGGQAVQSEWASPGDTYAAGVFTPRVYVAPVPTEVSMAQAVVALSRSGVSEDDIEALLAAMPDSQAKTEARAWWRRSNAVQRNHPVVQLLAPALGLNSAQVDDLFRLAATL